MSKIHLTYGDNDADLPELDSAILITLAGRQGYVIELTYGETFETARVEDVVIQTGTRDNLLLRSFDEASRGPVGPTFVVGRDEIYGIRIH